MDWEVLTTASSAGTALAFAAAAEELEVARRELQSPLAVPSRSPEINLDPDAWRRQVVEHCLYGVDINGMAVELAKLSLWLATMQVGRPLSFLDHHLKQGNSLLGASLEEIAAILSTDEFTQRTPKVIREESTGQRSFRTLPRVQQKLAQAADILALISGREVVQKADVEQQKRTTKPSSRCSGRTSASVTCWWHEGWAGESLTVMCAR